MTASAARTKPTTTSPSRDRTTVVAVATTMSTKITATGAAVGKSAHTRIISKGKTGTIPNTHQVVTRASSSSKKGSTTRDSALSTTAPPTTTRATKVAITSSNSCNSRRNTKEEGSISKTTAVTNHPTIQLVAVEHSSISNNASSIWAAMVGCPRTPT